MSASKIVSTDVQLAGPFTSLFVCLFSVQIALHLDMPLQRLKRYQSSTRETLSFEVRRGKKLETQAKRRRNAQREREKDVERQRDMSTVSLTEFD